jgi:deoxyribose-phosphate aldolase
MSRLAPAHIEHTLLRPDATLEEHLALAREAEQLGIPTVCVGGAFVAPLRDAFPALTLCTVANFPTGEQSVDTTLVEVEALLRAGAAHIDVVAPQHLSRLDRRDAYQSWLEPIIDAIHAQDAIAKVILETAPLDEQTQRALALACVRAGADYVKTSTGFHPAGGASVEAVAALAAAGAPCGVKASGGIRTRAQAEALLAAGATRIGASASRELLASA